MAAGERTRVRGGLRSLLFFCREGSKKTHKGDYDFPLMSPEFRTLRGENNPFNSGFERHRGFGTAFRKKIGCSEPYIDYQIKIRGIDKNLKKCYYRYK